jgi:T5SS/PEP-CTERM-associated repeat protein/autotransporter-associated beta strand protein
MRHVVSVIGSVLLIATPAAAQLFDWNNANGGSFSTAGNWTPAGPPGSSGQARFNLPNTYTVTFGGNVSNATVTVGQGNVTWSLGGFTYNVTGGPDAIASGLTPTSLRIQNGTVNTFGLSVADAVGSTATLTVDSGATLSTGSPNFFIGSANATGTVVVQNGGQLTTGQSYVGANANSSGSLAVNGPSSKWTIADFLRIGDAGNGSVTVASGGIVNAQGVTLAAQTGSSGILTVTGPASSLSAAGNLFVGLSAAASLNVLAGGTVTAPGMTMGEFVGSQAAATVSGVGSTLTVSGTALIGGLTAAQPAPASLVIGPGATVNFNGTTTLQSTAIININGGTLNLNTLNQQPGAALNWSAGTIRFANGSSFTPAVISQLLPGPTTVGPGQTLAATAGTFALPSATVVTGGGAINAFDLTTSSALTVNAQSAVSATDMVTLNSGAVTQVSDLGTLAATNGVTNNGLLQLNGPAAAVNGFVANNFGVIQGTGRLNNGLSNGTGGTIRARAGDYIVVDGVGPTNLGNIELSGGTIEFTKTLSNLGSGFISGRGEFRGSTANLGGTGLTNSGVMAFSGGTTDIRGDVQNNAGGHIVIGGGGVLTFYDDVVHNGAEIRTDGGSRTVFFGSQSGAGPFTGTGVVEYGGDLRPGNSPANVSYEGDVQLDPSSRLVMELGGTTPGSQYDRLTVQGTITLSGALEVDLINHFVPVLGESFMLIDNQGAGPLVGTFTGLAEGGLFTAGGVMFSADYHGGDGNDFVITAIPEPGTFALCGLAAAGWVAFWRRRWAAPMLIVPLLVGPATANDVTWSGTAVSPGAWSAGSNWVGGVVPVSNDNITFVNSTQNAATNNIQSNFQLNFLTFGASITSFTVNGSSLNASDSFIDMESNGSVAINNQVTMTSGQFNGAIITGGGTGTLTFNNTITGPNSLSIGDNFANTPAPITVALGSSGNTFTSAAITYGATLKLTVNSALSTGATVSIGSACKLDIGTTSNTLATAAGAITLSDGATFKVGASTNANFYMNGLNFAGGTLTDAGLSSGMTFHLTGGEIDVFAGASSPAIITLANNGKFVNDSGAPLTINVESDFGGLGLDVAARLSGSGNNSKFVKFGSGTLRLLSQSNTADLTMQQGRVRFDSVSAFTSGTMTFDEGTLGYYGVTASTLKSMATTQLGGTIEIGSANTTLTLNGAITGPGGITTTGPGTLVFGVPMSYAGPTTVSAGILRVAAANALSPTAGLNVNANAAFDQNGQTLTLSGLTIAAGGAMTMNGGALSVGMASLGGPLNGPGTLNLSGAATVSAANALYGPVAVTMTPGGSLTTGAFPVGIGSLASVLGGTITISAGGSLIVGLDNSSTSFAGTIQGPGPLTKVGSGVLTLTGSSTLTGGITVNAGYIAFAGDSSLGPVGSAVVVNPAGIIYPTGSLSTTLTYSLNGGTLLAPPGVTLTLNGATINGGFLRGNGALAATGGAAINGATSFASTTINQTGAASYLNFTNGGSLNIAAQVSQCTMNGLFNRGGGQIAVGDTAIVNVVDFESAGTLTVVPSTIQQTTLITNIGASPMYFDGGSRTFVGTPATAGSGTNPSFLAGIDLNGQNAVVAGGLFVNNGYVEDSSNNFQGTATIVADFGSLVKGAGYFQNTVKTINGGKFQAGNSPGKATFGSFVLGPGGVSNYVFAIDDATGAAGPSPDAAGHVSGWGVVKSFGGLTGGASGDLIWTATPTDKLTFAIETLVNPTTVGTDVAGQMGHFDPMRSYSWPAVEWTGAYAGPTDAATLNASTAFDTTGFLNSVAGTFGWQFDGADHMLSLTYTPAAVPEPGTLSFVAAALLPVFTCIKRRRAARPSPR